jgi:bacillithiol synthase
MEMLNLSLPANNRFATDYLAQKPDIMQFFHYPYQGATNYKRRVEELQGRTFQRNAIAQHIERYMANFPTSIEVERSLKKLKEENSVVIIGGQQAGVLTGPLYTIHKVISIIVLAKQKEEELGIPVVPVFWIAGEDHDYLEVNHIYREVNQKIEKSTYPQTVFEKKMVSDIMIDKEVCLSWVKEMIESLGETEHTNRLLDFTVDAIEKSVSLVDFFATIIMELFKESGLLIIDSGDKNLRILEQDYFLTLIRNCDEITQSVMKQQKQLNAAGFPITIDMKENAANIFYYDEETNSRILLEHQPESNLFIGKNSSIQFTFEELINLANEKPQSFSNNVVTRPMMQEWLFPTLAFIAGPGEIAYWSELKLAFEHFHFYMPPIVPRLNITLLERSIETDLQELGLSIDEVLRKGTAEYKEEFLHSVKDPELDQLFLQLRDDLSRYYLKITTKTDSIDKGLNPLIKKNEELLQKQIRFMEDKIHDSLHLKHIVRLRKMDRIGNALRPNGSPQERILNPYYYLNKYGFDLIKNLVNMDYRFDGNHKVIKL